MFPDESGGAGGDREPYPSPASSESALPGWYPGNSLLCHSPKYVRMSALSESRRELTQTVVYFHKKILRNDLHVI